MDIVTGVSERETRTPIGEVGHIVGASQAVEVGMSIEVLDDRDGSTGGLYILTWRGTEAYDGWVETIGDVDLYFDEAGYLVEWLDPAASAAARRLRPA